MLESSISQKEFNSHVCTVLRLADNFLTLPHFIVNFACFGKFCDHLQFGPPIQPNFNSGYFLFTFFLNTDIHYLVVISSH